MYDPECPVQREIDEFLNRIFPDAEVKNYALKVFSDMMDPVDQKENMIYIWLGAPATGKSTLLRLLQQACGSYVAYVDETILSGGSYFKSDYYKQAANRHLLVLADIEGQIRLENVKKLLHTTPVDLGRNFPSPGHVPLGAACGDLHILCNEVPRFEFGDNKIVTRRVRIIPFTQTFTHSPTDVVNPIWAPYFWQRLVHIYNEGLVRNEKVPWMKGNAELMRELPAAVKEAIEHHYPMKNSFETFMELRLCYSEEEQSTTMDTILKAYRAWMDGQPNPGRRLKKDEMYDALLGTFTLKIEGGAFTNLELV